jgi:hypothetical protein
VALLIVAAASGVAVGQQCALRPVPVLSALAKVTVAAAVAAAAMALLAYAGSGKLGNFGDVGVDQVTFGPAIFLWFVGIGALTVAMSGGIARRPKRAKPEPEPEPAEPEPEPDEPAADVEEPEPQPEVDEPSPLDEETPPSQAEPLLDDDDPEEHFVADDDTTPGVTRGNRDEAAD